MLWRDRVARAATRITLDIFPSGFIAAPDHADKV